MPKSIIFLPFILVQTLSLNALDNFSITTNKKVKVFILAGQSNMEGHGLIKGKPGQKGTLETLVNDPKSLKEFKGLIDSRGDWIVRDDVWISWLNKNGKLTVGGYAGKGSIGPELGFGWEVGNSLKEQIILLKFGPGGTSLAGPWRPPSSGGKDDKPRGEQDGSQYKLLVKKTKDVLSNVGKYFPSLTEYDLELAGFGWHQGWNDGCSMQDTKEYKKNLKNFINDIRKDLKVDSLPFVIAGSGFGGWNQSIDRRLMIIEAQKSVTELPEFKSSSKYVETRGFFRDGSVSPRPIRYHWCCNAETYWLIGQGMGKAMNELLGGLENPSPKTRKK